MLSYLYAVLIMIEFQLCCRCTKSPLSPWISSVPDKSVNFVMEHLSRRRFENIIFVYVLFAQFPIW